MDAITEEATLKRKLAELTSNVSDQGATSEEEQDGAELDPKADLPRAALEVRPPPTAVSARQGPGVSSV